MPPSPPAERRLLDAAARLFATRGIRGVGVDAVVREADVAKATLYRHFPSKAHLVAAYLDDRSAAWVAHLRGVAERHADNPAAAVGEVFDTLGDWFAEPGFTGCLWANVRAEQLDEPLVDEALGRHRRRLREVFAELAPDHAEALTVLYDGAIATARIDRSPASAAIAADLAGRLLTAAAPSGRGREDGRHGR